MDPDTPGSWVPLYEMLGMTPEDGQRITDDFAEIIRSVKSPGDLCKRVVELYGVDAVCMSMCLHIALEKLAAEHRSTIDARMMHQCPSKN